MGSCERDRVSIKIAQNFQSDVNLHTNENCFKESERKTFPPNYFPFLSAEEAFMAP